MIFQSRFALIVVIIIYTIVASSTGVFARCSRTDLAGTWAFLQSGTTQGSNNTLIRTSSIGVVELNGRGRVVDGWASIKAGSQSSEVAGYTGNFSLIEPCTVLLWLNSSQARYFVLGVIGEGKRHFDSFVNQANATITGEFSKINGNCGPSRLKGIWTTAGVTTTSNVGTSFAATLTCDGKKNGGSCDIVRFNQPTSTTPLEATFDADYNGTSFCKFTFGAPYIGLVAVPHHTGLYALQTNATADFAVNFELGQK
jgi:hypothetical protein